VFIIRSKQEDEEEFSLVLAHLIEFLPTAADGMSCSSRVLDTSVVVLLPQHLLLFSSSFFSFFFFLFCLEPSVELLPCCCTKKTLPYKGFRIITNSPIQQLPQQ
jgi:hypothetical protein